MKRKKIKNLRTWIWVSYLNLVVQSSRVEQFLGKIYFILFYLKRADWNPINKDLLAVTYGELDLNVNKEGFVCFWTLKNPTFPERIIRYPSSKL